MKKRSFLLPLASLAAALSGNQASANVQANYVDPVVDAKNTFVAQPQSGRLSVKNGDKQFEFLLKRTDTGMMTAAHYSHSSHASHASHSSHYSGY